MEVRSVFIMSLHQGHTTIKLSKKASEGYFWAPCDV